MKLSFASSTAFCLSATSIDYFNSSTTLWYGLWIGCSLLLISESMFIFRSRSIAFLSKSVCSSTLKAGLLYSSSCACSSESIDYLWSASILMKLDFGSYPSILSSSINSRSTLWFCCSPLIIVWDISKPSVSSSFVPDWDGSIYPVCLWAASGIGEARSLVLEISGVKLTVKSFRSISCFCLVGESSSLFVFVYYSGSVRSSSLRAWLMFCAAAWSSNASTYFLLGIPCPKFWIWSSRVECSVPNVCFPKAAEALLSESVSRESGW